jgi:uncharacterized protein (UPF0261 family)
MSTIAVLGTLDTKGIEHRFIADLIQQAGHTPLLIDVGILAPPQTKPDVTREEVAREAGIDLAALAARHDRGEAIAAMTRAAPLALASLAAKGKIQGVISLGGTGGTAIGTAAMRALPIGFPKVMVSTVASGNTSAYVGVKDIVMIPSIVDIAGLNRVSRQILTQAAGAIAGMVSAISGLASAQTESAKPLIVASMFGNTTTAVERARQQLEAAGYEVLVFHATGTGGRTMESLIEAGLAAGVLDLTTTEWADELVGGVLSAGPTRLEAAARRGVPAIIAPGCLDMVNFGPPETVPAKFAGRKFYPHNPQVTLMRTTPAECAELGRIIAQKVNLSVGPATVLIPLRAISVISQPGGAFHDPEADRALFAAMRKHLRPEIPVREYNCAINDAEFADACAQELLANIARANRAPA